MSESTVSITEMKNHFDEYLQRVKSGEVFIITKYGKPIAEFKPARDLQKEQKPLISEKPKDLNS